MTEEEKKAIEKFKTKIKYHLDNPLGTFVYTTLDDHYLKVILNLIEKLQKENEERKSEIEIFYKWLSFTCKELGISEDTPIIDMLQEIKENYVPKDKIREKIDTFFDNLIYAKDKDELKEALKEELLEEE